MSSPDIGITGYDGREYRIAQLTPELAEANAGELLAVHNLIPHVNWGVDDLMSDTHSSGAPYANKWDLSSIVFNRDEVVSFLMAWERGQSETHPFDAIYLHRMAMRADHQQNGVARQILNTALSGYAENVPGVDTYTLQTNDDEGNQHIIAFYESLGFVREMPVQYPDKVDVLMKMSRQAVLGEMSGISEQPEQ